MELSDYYNVEKLFRLLYYSKYLSIEFAIDFLQGCYYQKVYEVLCLLLCLQNLYHHIDDFDNENVILDSTGDKKSAIFSILRNDDSYNIVTGNFIFPKNVDEITKKINYINSLNRDELKAYYKEVLNNGKLSEKGGGGLGLIDIAKKSRNKLQYSFREIDDDYSFFTLTVKILK